MRHPNKKKRKNNHAVDINKPLFFESTTPARKQFDQKRISTNPSPNSNHKPNSKAP